MGTQVNPPGSDLQAKDLLLHIHLALVQAKDEHDILAALALSVEPAATARLIYLHLGSDGQPETADTVATLGDAPVFDKGVLPVKKMSLFDRMQNHPEPIWFLDDVGLALDAENRVYLGDPRSAILIKLYGAAHVEQAPQWHALVCITWQEQRVFSPQERFLCTSLWDSLCVVVSNHRLKVEALDNLRRLRALDRLKTEFLHMVSHELRTPLTGILTTAEMILFGEPLSLEPQLRADVETIHESGEHLLHIIQDILDMANIESGTMRVAREAVDVREVVEGAIQTVRPLATAKGLCLEVQIPSEFPLALGDGLRVRQILLNLLSNAVKFSMRGTISVGGSVRGDKIVLSVGDEGIGISAEAQQAIFNPFQRVDSPLARREGGTGLGLPISRRLVELQGGAIWLDSTPEIGTTFYFSLPLDEGVHAHPAH